ncbi:Ankyrin repeat protein 2 [Giardia muris]|uniref:Ankyrin repeat protein 2 n=1 Tax=Giardia muris TaxID=5742 RepID=A0A4Z1SNL1_GIAMU|nr:Ankyrin repeat protein 2 [Giardia muris]|eukprot:TNJ26465.1 Ankyrin repeat protein 2 [Giardia muris]
MSVTALMEAAGRGDLEAVKRNLNQAGKKDENGWTALMYAAINGRANCIPLLRKEIGTRDNWGWTALMLAARNGKTNCVQLLLSETGKKTTKEWNDFPSGTTALMLATHENYPDIVELLLLYEQGMTDSKGHTAQWHANSDTKIGDFTRVRQLLKYEGSERAPPPPKGPAFLQAFATVGDVEGVKKYVSHAGYQDSNGMTALMLAAWNGHTSCIPLLRDEIGKKDKDGETALMKAVRQGHANCVAHLEEEIGIRGKYGRTALMLAAEYGHANCIPLLNRELGKQSRNGETALMRVAIKGHTSCVQPLLSEARKQLMEERKFTLNGNTFTFPPGTTALMLAAHYNRPEVVELLLPYEQRLKDSKGHNAQWHAKNSSRGGDFTRVHELLEYEGLERIPPPTPGAANRRGVRELSSSRSLPEGMTCVICLTNPKDTLLQPCGHLCACSGCSGKLKGQSCPLCRTPVESTVKVYL